MKYALVLWLNNGTREKFWYDSKEERDTEYDRFRFLGVKPMGYFVGDNILIPYWAISKITREDSEGGE